MSIRKPSPRVPRPEVWDPAFEDLRQLSLLRIYHAFKPDYANSPPVNFPLAESMRWNYFTHDDWVEFGDLETEYARFAYTLSRYPERGAPRSCISGLGRLLAESSVLSGWHKYEAEFENHADVALEYICRRQRNQTAKGEWVTKLDYVTVPVDYEVSEDASTLSISLWNRALSELAFDLKDGNRARAEEFLRIFAFLKDPIYGFRKPFRDQTIIFKDLIGTLLQSDSSDELSLDDLKRVAAQGAQESAYLVCPLLKNVAVVHFKVHHQLCYVNVELDLLARAEWSVPSHVLEVAEEMLEAAAANNGRACPLVPILVTVRPSFARGERDLIPIIDGNHRATAVMMLRFIATQPRLYDRKDMQERLSSYCVNRKLGHKWEIDLMDVLDELYTEHHRLLREQLSSTQVLSPFATVESIPALFVQEEDFHTICKQRSEGKVKPVLLHPFHQTLFNDDSLPFALPQKAGQTHGRPEVFRLLPLTPFGAADQIDTTMRNFEAKLRESMNGLVKGSVDAETRSKDASEVRDRDVMVSVNRGTTVTLLLAGCCMAVFLARKHLARMV
ncbi:hypothetical protein GGR57DRAFT_300226 [Xylariaceae sp. FL1272]|nr:hypothetical protein GGR57DRAFT_300226 [Xylariaceae sp. FL1272]